MTSKLSVCAMCVCLWMSDQEDDDISYSADARQINVQNKRDTYCHRKYCSNRNNYYQLATIKSGRRENSLREAYIGRNFSVGMDSFCRWGNSLREHPPFDTLEYS